MTKEEIDQIVFREAMSLSLSGKSNHEVGVHLFKVAYNRAIEDALELGKEEYPHNGKYFTVDVEDLEQLKIS